MLAASLLFGLAGWAAETHFPVVRMDLAKRSPDVGGQRVECQSAPETFCLNGWSLEDARLKVLAKDSSLSKAVANIRREAEDVMRKKLMAVTDKTFVAPSGDKHDYVSLSPYFWPDPTAPKGLPYVLRDGETNPEAKKYDSGRLEKMCHNIEVLTLAYYLTGEEAYAERAAQQLRRWFLDPETRMNPNLNYAQMVKGKNEGSRWGIIDTWPLIHIVDGVALLDGSKSWTAADNSAMQKWFADYLVWLRTSDLGIAEANANNNHAVYYDVQVADFALFTGQTNLAREVLAEVGRRRIQTQIEPDGAMPVELARTKSLSYTLFNLSGFFTLARLGEIANVDLWNYRTADGRSLRGALDWMVPYATGQKPWTHKQITKETFAPMTTLLRQAANAYQEPAYEKLISKVKDASGENLLSRFLCPPASIALQLAMIDRARIFRLADQALALRPPAITDVIATNSACDMHDYFSQADYAWPNPTNQTGLPYIIREPVLNLARQRFKEVLLPNQMTNDGSFPREMARTKPYGYSIFQADNMATLCVLLSTTNEDFWRFTLPDGRTPRQAVDFIFPYLADKNKWLADGHARDTMHWENWPARQPCLILAYAEFGDPKYISLWKKLDPDPGDLEVRRNLAITQPLLWIARPDEAPVLKVSK